MSVESESKRYIYAREEFMSHAGSYIQRSWRCDLADIVLRLATCSAHNALDDVDLVAAGRIVRLAVASRPALIALSMFRLADALPAAWRASRLCG